MDISALEAVRYPIIRCINSRLTLTLRRSDRVQRGGDVRYRRVAVVHV